MAQSGSIGSHWSSRFSFMPTFVHPACDVKLPDTCVSLESLCVKSTTQKELKTQRAMCQGPGAVCTYIVCWLPVRFLALNLFPLVIRIYSIQVFLHVMKFIKLVT